MRRGLRHRQTGSPRAPRPRSPLQVLLVGWTEFAGRNLNDLSVGFLQFHVAIRLPDQLRRNLELPGRVAPDPGLIGSRWDASFTLCETSQVAHTQLHGQRQNQTECPGTSMRNS